MKFKFSIFKKKSTSDNKFTFKNPQKHEELKVKRNQYEFKKLIESNTNGSIKNIVNNFVIDAKSKSIPISKAVIAGDYKLAADTYTKTINNYKNYLLASGFSKSFVENIIFTFKRSLFKNLVSIMKKEIPKKVILRQSKLPKSKINKIKIIENDVIKDLHSIGLIKNPKKMNIRFSALNSLEEMLTSRMLDADPIKLFRKIYNTYASLKKGGKDLSVNTFIAGQSRIKPSNDKKKNYYSIAINTRLPDVDEVIVHELIHAYLGRENHTNWDNEVIVKFLSLLFTDKYFGKSVVLKKSANFEKNQYFIGYTLFEKYKEKYGFDLKHINKYLLSNKEYIKRNTL